jgi:hypothetical protein
MDAKMFEKWFQEQLVPKLTLNSVTVMYNAAYHSRLLIKDPTKSSRKEEIIKFMEAKNIDLPAKRTKIQLLNVVEDSNIYRIKSYVVDNLAREKAHIVFKTTSLLLHFQYNRIDLESTETCGKKGQPHSKFKRFGRRFN